MRRLSRIAARRQFLIFLLGSYPAPTHSCAASNACLKNNRPCRSFTLKRFENKNLDLTWTLLHSVAEATNIFGLIVYCAKMIFIAGALAWASPRRHRRRRGDASISMAASASL
jgi:hypothetical protein